MAHAPTYHPSVTHPQFRGRAWVYYILRDGNIKIGTTRNLARRMGELRPESILALESGWRKRETARHAQFERERLPQLPSGETEWFEPSDRLLRHIAKLAQRNPPPTLPVGSQIRTILEMENEPPVTPEETTVEIPPVPAVRPKLPVQARSRKKIYASALEVRPIAVLRGDPSMWLSDAWPFMVVLYSIAISTLAEWWSFWVIPVGLLAMILFYHWYVYRVAGFRGREIQARLDEGYASVRVRRGGLGWQREDEDE